MNRRFKYTVGLAVFLAYTGLLAPSIHGQVLPGEVGRDSIQTALFPAAAYDTDLGLIGGGLYSRIDYRGDNRPFRNYIRSTVLASTKGMVSAEFSYDQTRTFSTDIRSSLNLYAFRYTYDYYFGIGNDTPFSEQRYDEEYFFFESRSIALKYEARKPIYREGDSRLDLTVGFETKYEQPDVKKPDSRFNLDRPRGFSGGWVNALSTGIIWENRNSEFDPTAGIRSSLRLRFAPEFLFSRYGLVSVEGDYRHYFRLFDWVTVAQRVQARHAEGDLPYWERSRLGDDETLRGYALNRFLGNSSLAYSLELRKWVLSFDEYAIKMGGILFTDAGRVFLPDDGWDELLSGYKQTVGIGGMMSVFNPDFILRGEIGFSSETTRIYIGIGYTF